ncbi:right-handed parallel beta-helix repeat-containing protein [Novosphingobium sp.]|uniref:right-handed parallel beta-helix repeat-containing protein n=1 Tax=Novosphingobium sp. TaxID=1874826 RepID=UPI003D6D860D
MSSEYVALGEWCRPVTLQRLRLTGTGTVTIDTRNALGVTSLAVVTYVANGANNQVEFPTFPDDAVEVRVRASGAVSAAPISTIAPIASKLVGALADQLKGMDGHGSYAEALGASKPLPLLRVSAFFGGVVVEWVRSPGGPCLGGGWIPSGVAMPHHFGAVALGLDDTAVLKKVFEFGGDVYIPRGNYLIAAAGPDSGGVEATITRSLEVRCHADARFYTAGLDNDLIRIQVPSNGTGVPAQGVTLSWTGGFFDQSGQKNSTSMPFLVEYPALYPGASQTCDGLSIRGEYVLEGKTYAGIRRATVAEVTCYAGEHWQTAGGDSGIFVSGCSEQIIERNRLIGCRDLGVYASGSADGLLRCLTTIQHNEFVNSFHGAAIKRSAGASRILGNHAENCVRGFLIDRVIGPGFTAVEVAGNTANKCGIPIRLQASRGFSVHDNHCTNLGSLLSDGQTVEAVAGCNGIELYGCSYGVVADNSVDGVLAVAAAAYASGYNLLLSATLVETSSTQTQFVSFRGNVGFGLRTGGSDTGLNNTFECNVVFSAVTSANLTALGTNSVEIRVDPATNVRSWTTPLQFADGSSTSPAIARRGQVNTGVYFGTNLIGVTANGTKRIECNSTGIGLNGAAPVAKPSISGSRGGNAALASLLTNLATMGLLTDATTA